MYVCTLNIKWMYCTHKIHMFIQGVGSLRDVVNTAPDVKPYAKLLSSTCLLLIQDNNMWSLFIIFFFHTALCIAWRNFIMFKTFIFPSDLAENVPMALTDAF